MKSEYAVDGSKPVELTKDVLSDFPKVELHRHLEGTFALPALHRMALRNKLAVPTDFGEFKRVVQFPRDSDPDFLTFLSKFRNDWYASLGDVEEIAYESIRSFGDDGIFYIEVRFSPEHFAEQNRFDREEVTRLIVGAGNTAASETGIQVRYLITFNRSKQAEEGMIQLYRTILKLDLPEIVGIDLAGDEINYPPKLFTRFFQAVHDDGAFGTTIHAGEVTPAWQVWEAVNTLHADRIGHGTSATDDPDLQAVLRDRNIALEQCITSNRQTGSWSDEARHPFGGLYRNGVPVTLNSDDPTIQDSDLTDDYLKAVQYFDLDATDLARINRTALATAFVSEQERRFLEDRYSRRLQSFAQAHRLKIDN